MKLKSLLFNTSKIKIALKLLPITFILYNTSYQKVMFEMNIVFTVSFYKKTFLKSGIEIFLTYH